MLSIARRFLRWRNQGPAWQRGAAAGSIVGLAMAVYFYLSTDLLWTIPVSLGLGAVSGWIAWRLLRRVDGDTRDEERRT